MTDETDPHPIARASLYERMSNIAREAGGNPAPSPIEAARAHLGSVADLIPDQAAIAPRGSVEDAMIAGADLETGELPAREADLPTASSGTGVSPLAHTIPPAAPSVTAEMEPAMEAAPAPPSKPANQEVIEPERAADGGPAPYAASTLGELVNLLEGGQLSADAILAVSALGQGMRELAERTGKRQKGRVAIVLNLATDDTGEAFFVEAEFKVTAPKEPRRKTMLWQDEKGRMTPSQPRQRVFFGVKDVGDMPRQIRQIP